MAEWLKRDPSNGCLIGPDGAHYANEHKAAHFALLGLCGCGDPVAAYNFCRDVLVCFDRRGCHDRPSTREWISAEVAVAELIKSDPEVAAHVISHLLGDRDGLLEHGGNISHSWLDCDGERIVDMPPMTEELMDQNP